MMKLGVKGTNRTLTAESKSGTIVLPQEIKDAILQGYDVYITKSVREGVVSAKITFHRVKVAGVQRLGGEMP